MRDLLIIKTISKLFSDLSLHKNIKMYNIINTPAMPLSFWICCNVAGFRFLTTKVGMRLKVFRCAPGWRVNFVVKKIYAATKA